MKLDKLIEAFLIFKKYMNDDMSTRVSAEHDIVYAGPDPIDVSEKDKKRLEELGWYPDKSFDCFYFMT